MGDGAEKAIRQRTFCGVGARRLVGVLLSILLLCVTVCLRIRKLNIKDFKDASQELLMALAFPVYADVTVRYSLLGMYSSLAPHML